MKTKNFFRIARVAGNTSRGGENTGNHLRQISTKRSNADFYLDFHKQRFDDVDFVSVPAPHAIMHHRHASDCVVRATQIQQVVILQIPHST